MKTRLSTALLVAQSVVFVDEMAGGSHAMPDNWNHHPTKPKLPTVEGNDILFPCAMHCGEAETFHFPDQDVEINAEGRCSITDEYGGTYTLILSMTSPITDADLFAVTVTEVL